MDRHEISMVTQKVGTYLATFHDRGIALWVGEEFDQFMRFAHQNVQLIDFPPLRKLFGHMQSKSSGH